MKMLLETFPKIISKWYREHINPIIPAPTSESQSNDCSSPPSLEARAFISSANRIAKYLDKWSTVALPSKRDGGGGRKERTSKYDWLLRYHSDSGHFKIWTRIFHCPMSSGVKEGASGWASSPVLTSQFQDFQDFKTESLLGKEILSFTDTNHV